MVFQCILNNHEFESGGETITINDFSNQLQANKRVFNYDQILKNVSAIQIFDQWLKQVQIQFIKK